jgi:ParB-like chromosome segregation protein Spo0J
MAGLAQDLAEKTMVEDVGFGRLPLDAFEADETFRLRYRLEDPKFVEWIRTFGFVSPLFAEMRQGGRARLVSGFRRFHAASRVGMKDLAVWFVREGRMDPKELFAIALVLNQATELSDLDRSVAIMKARDGFGFSWEELEEMAPLLGLAPSRKVMEEYDAVGRMDARILAALDAGKIPFQGARTLVVLRPEARDALAREVLARCEFSASELRELVEWLQDLSRRERETIPALLARPELMTALGASGSPREKGMSFIGTLRALRFPLVSAWEDRFQEVKRSLEGSEGILLSKPPFFEGDTFTLSLSLRSQGEFRSLLERLLKHESLFKALFDLVE